MSYLSAQVALLTSYSQGSDEASPRSSCDRCHTLCSNTCPAISFASVLHEIFLLGSCKDPDSCPDLSAFLAAGKQHVKMRTIPWFGDKPDDPTAPAHGFVRTKAWQLESIVEAGDAVTVNMFTESDEDTKRWWPAEFRLVLMNTCLLPSFLNLADKNISVLYQGSEKKSTPEDAGSGGTTGRALGALQFESARARRRRLKAWV
jgi:hypothetical protein